MKITYESIPQAVRFSKMLNAFDVDKIPADEYEKTPETHFKNLSEIKQFIQLVDLHAFTRKEIEWGGLGYIITNRDEKGNKIQRTYQSKVVVGRDVVILTPFYRQISWFFRILTRHVYDNKEFTPDILLDGFKEAAEKFLSKPRDYFTLDFMMYVIDELQKMIDERNSDEKEL